MMNNPVLQMMNAMRSGMQPVNFIQQMAMSDPRAAQAMQIIRGKTPQELKQIAQNMARERNIDLEDFRKMFGM